MKILKTHKNQTLAEEIANSITHGLGAIASLVASIYFIISGFSQGSLINTICASVFGASLFAMYLASSFYHAVQCPIKKITFKKIDHISIYLLIAGSYTPFTLITIGGSSGLFLFCLIWALALCGLFYKLFFIHHFHNLTVVIYLLMGWLAIFAIKPITTNLPVSGQLWLLIGGLFYTFGVIFYAWKRLYFSHALWHCFVLAGSFCHFIAISFYVLL